MKKNNSIMLLVNLMLVSVANASNPSSSINGQTWQNLCPPNTPITQGCYPDCQRNGSKQSAACRRILEATSVEAIQGITLDLTIPGGMYVQLVSPNINSLYGYGPTIIVAGLPQGQGEGVVCSLHTTNGNYIQPGVSGIPFNYSNGSFCYTDNIHPCSSMQNPLYQTADLPTFSPFYLICLGYSANTQLNVSVLNNISANW